MGLGLDTCGLSSAEVQRPAEQRGALQTRDKRRIHDVDSAAFIKESELAARGSARALRAQGCQRQRRHALNTLSWIANSTTQGAAHTPSREC